MPRKVFVAGEILTASDVNTNLMDQSVMVFDDASARTTAIPTPVEGMVTYLKDLDRLEQFDGTNFVVAAPAQTGVLQVVSTTVSTTASASVGTFSYADVPGLSATITPSSTSSKILVSYVVNGRADEAQSSGYFMPIQIVRASTVVGGGVAAGSRKSVNAVTHIAGAANGQGQASVSSNFLDSPNTTSATTYKLQVYNTVNGTVTALFNRGQADIDQGFFMRSSSTITLMEVAG